ncbi:MAG: response regulator [bacterium]|nr:response regulator [bacterium]
MKRARAGKHREILGPFYALIGVVALAAAAVAIVVGASHSHQQGARDRLERFHLQTTMLMFEASKSVTVLDREIRAMAQRKPRESESRSQLAPGRTIRDSLYPIGRALDSIAALQREWSQPVDPFANTVQRAAQQYRDLEEEVSREPHACADLESSIAALGFTLFQLQRLHAIASTDLLVQLETSGRRTNRRVGWMTALVLLVSGSLVARILVLVRMRLHRHDRTEELLLERERRLQHSSKMEALGSLVGGVAHDFNNLLTAILGNTEVLQMRMEPTAAGQRQLQEIRKSGERAASLTRQLLTFSRQQAVELRVLDLNLLIRDSEQLLRRMIREDIELVLRLDARAGIVEADPVQVEQVLMNLAVNARDAMQDGGVLTVATSDVPASASDHAADGCGSFGRIDVEDTGSGMMPDTRSKAFDPFFTTKETGKGTGLGLSTVHGIVTKSGGRIRIHSDVGSGTRFEILLPRCERASTELRAVAARGPSTGGTETILVAEDEPQVRRLIVDGLRAAGYGVVEASDGTEAFRKCVEHTGPLNLIVSDVVMPGMRGPELVGRVLALRPGTRVIYVSGYAEDEVLSSGHAADAPLLTKPFRLERLLALVRQELDAVDVDGRTRPTDRHAQPESLV